MSRDVPLLPCGFDGAGPNGTDCGDGVMRRPPKLDKQLGCYSARASQSSHAVDQHIKTIGDPMAELRTDVSPSPFKVGAGHADVANWQVMPRHVALSDALLKPVDPERPHFVSFDERNDGTRAPITNAVEIGVKIAIPRSRDPMPLLLAGAQCDAYPA